MYMHMYRTSVVLYMCIYMCMTVVGNLIIRCYSPLIPWGEVSHKPVQKKKY